MLRNTERSDQKMLKEKNKLMLIYGMLAIVLSAIFHLLNRVMDVMHSLMGSHYVLDESTYGFTLNTLFVIPIALWIIAYILYRRNSYSDTISIFNTLSLTFSSISIISGGGGMVELHFSIFMVVAIIAYYDRIKLVTIMTSIFAVQHLIGLIWLPELVFGASSYSVSMVLLHAIFLIITSLATIKQISVKNRVLYEVEAAKQEKEQKLDALLINLKQLAGKLGSSTLMITEQSNQHMRSSNEMITSFQEVTSGLEKQNDSISSINIDLSVVKELMNLNSTALQVLHDRTNTSKKIMDTGYVAMESLNQHIQEVSEAIKQALKSVISLEVASQQIDDAMTLISQISKQTKLLSLNASIEASKAGTEGRGFAVVAKEISILADQSKHATDEIREVLMNIVRETQSTMNNIKIGEQGTMQTVQLGYSTVNGYTNMQHDNEEMSNIIKQLYVSSQELQVKTEDIFSEILNMSALTEQGVASLEQLYATTEQQQSVTREIDTEINTVNQLAQVLRAQFKS